MAHDRRSIDVDDGCKRRIRKVDTALRCIKRRRKMKVQDKHEGIVSDFLRRTGRENGIWGVWVREYSKIWIA
jgi:hypothetical protein